MEFEDLDLNRHKWVHEQLIKTDSTYQRDYNKYSNDEIGKLWLLGYQRYSEIWDLYRS